VGYIVPIHGPLDGPLYMGSIYTNRYSHPMGINKIDETVIWLISQQQINNYVHEKTQPYY